MLAPEIADRLTAGARALLVLAAGRVERLRDLGAVDGDDALDVAERDLSWAKAVAQEWGIDAKAEIAAATETPR